MPRTMASVSLLSLPGSGSVMTASFMASSVHERRSRLDLPRGRKVAPSPSSQCRASQRRRPPSAMPVAFGSHFGDSAFAQVVSLLHAKCTVLPARFGSCCSFRGDAQGNARAAGCTSFLAALDAIEGCEEMGLRAVWGTLRIARNEPRRQIASNGPRAEPMAASAPARSCAIGQGVHGSPAGPA